jgi:hypothetical protein
MNHLLFDFPNLAKHDAVERFIGQRGALRRVSRYCDWDARFATVIIDRSFQFDKNGHRLCDYHGADYFM